MFKDSFSDIMMLLGDVWSAMGRATRPDIVGRQGGATADIITTSYADTMIG